MESDLEINKANIQFEKKKTENGNAFDTIKKLLLDLKKNSFFFQLS